MMKKLCQIIGGFVLVFFMAASVHASGKMEVAIGSAVTLTADDVGNLLSYKWVLKKEDKILNTQNQREFKYIFNEPGEYLVSFSLTDQKGVTKMTKVWALVGDTYAVQAGGDSGAYGVSGASGSASGPGNLGAASSLTLRLQTLPPKAADDRIHLLGDGKVAFDLHESSGEIIEYRIDQNIFKDSDGNGVANDDVDNAGDTSYLTGRTWEAAYKNEGVAQVVAEATLVGKDGKKVKSQVEIAFDPLPDRMGDPVAVLDVSPKPDPATQKVTLYGDEAEVSFYARASTGNILEYRIDKDVFTDSDKDGKPDNDIDNLNDPSFKTGDVWRTTYKKTDTTIIAQLIAVGPGGKGSRVQRALVFTNRPSPKDSPSKPSEIRIEANKSFVRKNDPVEFQVTGLQQAMEHYTFQWDFQGDGTVDKEVDGQNVVQQIYDEVGAFTVKVKIVDREGNSGERTLPMTVKEESKTQADFSWIVENGIVVFENRSVASEDLSNKSLKYEWSFGDTDEANFTRQQDKRAEEAPRYEYTKPGSYPVTLRVTDAGGVLNESTQTVEVTEEMIEALQKGAKPADTGATTPTDQPASSGSNSGLLIRIIKIVLYVVLGLIALILLLVGGLIAVIKLQHPDLGFDEVIEELRFKVLNMLGVHEQDIQAVTHEDAVPSASPPSGTEKTEELPVEGEVVSNEPPQEPEEPQKSEPPSPPSSSPSSPPSSPPPPPASDNSGPIPDWLKNA